MPFDLSRETRKLERKLSALRANDGLPQGVVELLAATRKKQLEARAAINGGAAVELTPEDRARHLQGAALLPRDRFVPDEAAGSGLFDELLAVVAGMGGPLAEAAGQLRAAETAGAFSRAEAFRRYLADDQGYFAEIAAVTPGAPRLAAFLVQASLTPLLEARAAATVTPEELKATWAHGHCPVCGSLPLIGRLLETEGHRWLTCSFCHTEYRAKRLQCPFCQEEDMDKLEYFDVTGEPGFHVNVCRSCNGYIKTVDFRKLDRPSLPLLDDLESLALDMLATREGLKRPTFSAWGF